MAEKKKHVILTGTSSGLGEYFLLRRPDSKIVKTKTFDRDIKDILNSRKDIDLLIHCAHASAFESNYCVDNYAEYLRTNVVHTEKLIDTLKPKKVVYISSVDVHSPKHTNYKLTKAMSENIVRAKVKDNLILRCSAIFGPTMRDNSVLKVIKYNNLELKLASHSLFNCILQKDVFEFVEMAVERGMRGTFDFVSSTYMSLEDVCKRYDTQITFGKEVYITPAVSNEAIKRVFPQADRTSEEVLDIIIGGLTNV